MSTLIPWLPFQIEITKKIYIYIYIYDFKQLETIRSFGDSIYTGKISVNEADMDQTNLSDDIAHTFDSVSRRIHINP